MSGEDRLEIHLVPAGGGSADAQRGRILSVAEQHGEIVLYAQVDTEQPKVNRRVQFIDTGQSFKAEGLSQTATFVGTAKLADGALMFHVFTEPEKR